MTLLSADMIVVVVGQLISNNHPKNGPVCVLIIRSSFLTVPKCIACHSMTGCIQSSSWEKKNIRCWKCMVPHPPLLPFKGTVKHQQPIPHVVSYHGHIAPGRAFLHAVMAVLQNHSLACHPLELFA